MFQQSSERKAIPDRRGKRSVKNHIISIRDLKLFTGIFAQFTLECSIGGISGVLGGAIFWEVGGSAGEFI